MRPTLAGAPRWEPFINHEFFRLDQNVEPFAHAPQPDPAGSKSGKQIDFMESRVFSAAKTFREISLASLAMQGVKRKSSTVQRFLSELQML